MSGQELLERSYIAGHCIWVHVESSSLAGAAAWRKHHREGWHNLLRHVASSAVNRSTMARKVRRVRVKVRRRIKVRRRFSASLRPRMPQLHEHCHTLPAPPTLKPRAPETPQVAAPVPRPPASKITDSCAMSQGQVVLKRRDDAQSHSSLVFWALGIPEPPKVPPKRLPPPPPPARRKSSL